MNESHTTTATLNDYIDGLLNEAERQSVERHLAQCAQCRSELASLQRLVADVSNLPTDIKLPDQFFSDVENELQKHSQLHEVGGLVNRRNGSAQTERETRRQAALPQTRWWIARIAAVFLLLATAGAMYFLLKQAAPDSNEIVQREQSSTTTGPLASEARPVEPKQTEDQRPAESNHPPKADPSTIDTQLEVAEVRPEIQSLQNLPQEEGKLQSPMPEQLSLVAAQEGRVLEGVVKDINGNPAANVIVSLLEVKDKHATTDSLGNFIIKDLPIGTYTVRAHSDQLGTKDVPNVVVDEQKTIVHLTLPKSSQVSIASAPPVAKPERTSRSNGKGNVGSISGVIKDAQTGEPLFGVNVQVVGTTRGATTDLDGKYTISDLPIGSYILRGSQVGYAQIELKNVQVRGGTTTPVDLKLAADAIAMQSITITADRALVNQMATGSTQVASPDALASAPSVNSVDDVLKLQTGAAKDGNNLYLRGGRSDEVKYLVDGMPTDNIAGNAGELSTANPSDEFSRTYAGTQARVIDGQTNEVHSKRKSYSGDDIILSESARRTKASTEEYSRIYENEFLDVRGNPLSTFSIDVDAASYTNIRRFLNDGMLPPPDAVRIEEMVNYFRYDYPQPKGEHPFSIVTEVASCPWNREHSLVLIGLQGKNIDVENLPANNLVFLIDVSGSMNSPDKLPLVKSAFRLLIRQLRHNDRVSIVVYAGNAGLVLPSTRGSDKDAILYAIDALEAGGSTAGGAGIQLAYRVAKENFIRNGNNRVILATDGDFNVGVSNTGDLVRMIEQKREEGIFLSILGFGTGNYKDDRMQQLADKGNGNHYYVDNIQEARRVFVGQMTGTLFTIAKDVKLQIEFNPVKVQSYRLIGYENRMLKKEDFNDDKKDAGELGAGHTVTALYEIVPAEQEEMASVPVDPLKYQNRQNVQLASNFNELLTVKFRYKPPKESKSILIEKALTSESLVDDDGTENIRFAAAVAEFGMILRSSRFAGDASFNDVLRLARRSKGIDHEGQRTEFIELVETAKSLHR